MYTRIEKHSKVEKKWEGEVKENKKWYKIVSLYCYLYDKWLKALKNGLFTQRYKNVSHDTKMYRK